MVFLCLKQWLQNSGVLSCIWALTGCFCGLGKDAWRRDPEIHCQRLSPQPTFGHLAEWPIFPELLLFWLLYLRILCFDLSRYHHSINEPGITLRLSSQTGCEDMLISKFKFFRDMVGRRHAGITDAEHISNRDEPVLPCLCRHWKPPLLPAASALQQADISQGTCWAPVLSTVAFWFRFPSCLWTSWLVPPSPSTSTVFKPNQTKPKTLCSRTDKPVWCVQADRERAWSVPCLSSSSHLRWLKREKK